MSPYEVLGVSPDASPDELRQAYLRLARLHHPDVVPAAERSAADARMRAINEAWAAVRNGRAAPTRPPPAEQGFRPFDATEPDLDPRDAPDVPYRPGTSTGRAPLVPVLLAAAAVVALAVSLVVRLIALLAIGLVLLALAAVGFVALPLLALGKAHRDD